MQKITPLFSSSTSNVKTCDKISKKIHPKNEDACTTER